MIIPKKLPKDPNQRAHAIARMLTEGPEPGEVVTERSARMAEIGRKGGQRGGVERSRRLSPQSRSEIARKAANARWRRTPKS
jgi:general stress protein YciG